MHAIGFSRALHQGMAEHRMNGRFRGRDLVLRGIHELAVNSGETRDLLRSVEVKIADDCMQEGAKTAAAWPRGFAWKRLDTNDCRDRRRLHDLGWSDDVELRLAGLRNGIRFTLQPLAITPDAFGRAVRWIRCEDILLMQSERFRRLQAQARRIPPDHLVLSGNWRVQPGLHGE